MLAPENIVGILNQTEGIVYDKYRIIIDNPEQIALIIRDIVKLATSQQVVQTTYFSGNSVVYQPGYGIYKLNKLGIDFYVNYQAHIFEIYMYSYWGQSAVNYLSDKISSFWQGSREARQDNAKSTEPSAELVDEDFLLVDNPLPSQIAQLRKILDSYPVKHVAYYISTIDCDFCQVDSKDKKSDDHWIYQVSEDIGFLPESLSSQEKILIADLQEFISHEHNYKQQCLSYSRVYFLNGTESKNKSIRILAENFEMAVYILKSQNLARMQLLVNRFNRNRKHNILLLDNIDRDFDSSEIINIISGPVPLLAGTVVFLTSQSPLPQELQKYVNLTVEF